jgi:hypothetical protein
MNKKDCPLNKDIPQKNQGCKPTIIDRSNHYGIFIFLFVSCLLLSQIRGFGQSADSARTRYPNIVKYSISSYLLYPNSFHMGYERVLTKNKSIYLFGGLNQFPIKLNLDLSNTHFTNAKNKSGYSIGAEFRFYLTKENKYNAPHGVYLAPFVSYYKFNSDNTLTHTDSAGSQSVNLSTSASFFSVGLELGYQFVVFKRFIIDAELFGPSFTTYAFQAQVNGSLNGLDEHETLQAVLDALKNKFPFLNDLSSSKTVFKSGVASSKFPAVGFRYVVSIGFMF